MNGLATYVLERETAWPDDLVEQYAPLVKRIAFHLLGRLPDSVQVDDLIQAGMLGLLEAARKYCPGRGASFETFAGIRIRGAMLDEVRRADWTPRSVHRRSREMARVMHVLGQRNGREATEQEIIAEMDIEAEEYYRIVQDAVSHRLLSLDDTAPDQDEPVVACIADLSVDLERDLQRQQLREQLTAAIASLSERQRLVMGLYYAEELNLREIGNVLGVSESRVCQIHGQTLLQLRAFLSQGAQLTGYSG